ncbi:MAG: four helix bundle protein [Candidatus Cloacimonadota bacterium]|nr:MAG: four helix bundle protein [Candidatus Cloacimonadota bacterium]
MKSEKDNRAYKKLKVYQLSHELSVRVHKMSLNLPKFEMFEEGSQIRRSSKSVSNNIVEGYVLRKYKREYIHYLYRALASSVETIEHLDYLYETGSLQDKHSYESLLEAYKKLGSMLYKYIRAIEKGHESDLVGNV